MNKTTRLALSATLFATLLSALPAMASAQDDKNENRDVPSLEFQAADAREALHALFKTVDVSYAIAPEVQGQVTLSLKHVTFANALQNILRQIDATYRIEAGVYQIVKRQDAPVAPSPEPGPLALDASAKLTRRIKVRSADPMLIALLLGSKAGTQSYTLPPEISSLQKGGGSNRGGSGIGGGSLGGSSGGFGSNLGGGGSQGGFGSTGGGSFGGSTSGGGSGLNRG